MDDYKTCYDKGEQLFLNGKWAEAIVEFDKAIALRPQHIGSLYRKGEAQYKLGRYLEAATAFWTAYLFFKFTKEPLLMCGRSLAAADFPYEACGVFDRIEPKDIDDESCIFFISALVREMRIGDAARLLPRIEHKQGYNANLVRGQVLQELGRYEEARINLETAIKDAPKGHVHDRLVAVYLGLRQYDKLYALLKDGAERYPDHREHYAALLAGFEVMLDDKKVNLADFHGNRRADIVESALYFRAKVGAVLPQSGSTIETFTSLAAAVPPMGIICEFGVRHGHSINHLGKLFPQHKIFGFDSFEGLPEAWHDEAAGSYTTGGRMPSVPENVTLIRGWFNETLPGFIKDHPDPIALMNIDCDIYSSTKTVFDLLGPQIVPGTLIVFDEYIGSPNWKEDEFKAFQEWVAARQVRYEYLLASLYTKQVAVRIIAIENNTTR
ncbi:class I SAM-dependent methyltransferase [Thauera aromatica]|uniref:class I SAM-dependent methyltransferase n=1 Tax=Thauera aromatica TaxID=59405 RepID=UPI001FFC6A64|nr:class I SAM-dependent methyltransferase [Thauera aromatica]MCK2097394.1 tetratricopeptide repeat protein [Thauera aromatica]